MVENSFCVSRPRPFLDRGQKRAEGTSCFALAVQWNVFDRPCVTVQNLFFREPVDFFVTVIVDIGITDVDRAEALRASPSVLFDAITIIAGSEGDRSFAQTPDAVSFLMDAQRHCKAVAWNGTPGLAEKAGIHPGAGLIVLEGRSSVREYVDAARVGRFWDREDDPALGKTAQTKGNEKRDATGRKNDGIKPQA